ncbi:hypothetical protein CGZ93_18100 [Enemella dayhoffiae]|uniref:Uncharacterized protein n=1 Tax=Enemella dayhoffiae TaxID=2016507 RepID=A0A255GMQ4_9ACTN|nr:hypothetical protein [Enemella dayhoffiae]OYO16672.1 hypothetical protein CGZ93_18100 [Enemella dayhoffiae]
MKKKVLLVGRNQWVVDGAKRELDSKSLTILGALTITDVNRVLTQHDIDHVFIGPGLDLEIRLAATRAVFARNVYTTVHLKDHSTGPEGGLDFVRAILHGLAELDK